MKGNKRTSTRSLLPWLIPCSLIIVWQLMSITGILSERIIPAPTQIIEAAILLLGNGELYDHMSISLTRAAVGFIIGGSIGFMLGLLNGVFRISDLLFDTSIQMLRNIPHLALIPLVIFWFGIGETSKIFLVALGVLFPVYINTYHGIKSVDKRLIEMGESYGLKGYKLFFHVILPGALSSILVGIRFSLGVMWLTLIVAETISAQSGIGYMAMNAREFMQMDIIVLSILIYAVFGKVSDVIARYLEGRLLKWNT
ncbi:aliphatic sulfonate ABC transporter permease SsuC [Oceanobacillus sp. AG]|uniref:aliphatic sulfonate ABC transporter permease SsuC n=1 Tax=Oceanobacillus sp. AG TaxID=2681969 RepID=UPI0012EB3531|nr:aliphatic sulfonate ABC transporter permease SsuC [Oceanobacillus sp. AG]